MEPGILPQHTGGWELQFQLWPVGGRTNRLRVFSAADCTVVTPCEGPHSACGRAERRGLTPIARTVRAAGPPSPSVQSLAGRLPCLGVLSGVPSIAVEDGVAGEQPIAMETVHPVAMRILEGFF